MKIKTTIFAIAATSIFGVSSGAAATVVYNADFSVDGIGFTHTTDNPPAPSDSASGANWTISYDSQPSTDGSTNSFITDGGALTASDWGGGGSFISSTIDVSSLDLVDISGLGSGVFNNPPTEFFTWFYSLDGGAAVTADLPSGDFDQTFSNVDVSGGSSLVVGFNFNHNGGSDGFSISSVSVEAVPEPSSALLGALGALMLLRRRR